MQMFEDATGHVWKIDINIATIRRVEKEMKIDLLDIADGTLIARLADDPRTLCDVLWVLVRDEAKTFNITDEDFGRAMAGDAIARATTALLQDLVDFFPNPRRQVLARLLEKLTSLQNVAAQTITKKLDNPKLEKQLVQLLSGNPSGSTRVASASRPKRSKG